jgi:hypothetical protein
MGNPGLYLSTQIAQCLFQASRSQTPPRRTIEMREILGAKIRCSLVITITDCNTKHLDIIIISRIEIRHLNGKI